MWFVSHPISFCNQFQPTLLPYVIALFLRCSSAIDTHNHLIASLPFSLLLYRLPLNQSTKKPTMKQPSYSHRTSIYTVGCQTLVFNLNRRLLNTCHWCWRSREVIRIQPSSSFRFNVEYNVLKQNQMSQQNQMDV
ncbi:hypothetical protein LXL04_039748 [Taraxacum kok-saghyz]